MAQSKTTLYVVAKCPTLIFTHMADVARRFSEYDAIAQKAVAHYVDWSRDELIARLSKHAKPILALMN